MPSSEDKNILNRIYVQKVLIVLRISMFWIAPNLRLYIIFGTLIVEIPEFRES